MREDGSIFVQIPSYRDTQLIPTLVDLIRAAESPGKLNIVVCWQHAADESIGDFESAGFSYAGESHDDVDRIHGLWIEGCRVRLIDVDYLKSRGCGWARHKIQRYSESENFSLQIDSHHRFTTGWDAALIGMINELRCVSSKPLLTGYPPAFDPDRDPESRQMDAIQMNFDRFSPPGIVHFKSSPMADWKQRQAPMRARFLSGGFVFADGSFVFDVPNDGDHFFASEEITLAVRAYTHGYDLFHPHRPILWHQYRRVGEAKVWDDHTSQRKSIGAVDKTAKERAVSSYLRSRELLRMEASGTEYESFGRFGLGSVRTIEDYERYAGLSFRFEGVTQATMDGAEPELLQTPSSGENWLNELICCVDAHIRIAPDDMEQAVSTGDRVTVGVFSRDGTEVYRFKLSSEEMMALRDDKPVSYRINFAASPKEKPVRYEVAHQSASGARLSCKIRSINDELFEKFVLQA
ncbi:UDP-N-acetylglucosamine-transferase [Dyella terrae]|uniref:UDP-N-acetylglucosamine-transferase n=1 Tax=Dyella terrae TaxID=522259 RepID=UPI001EFDE02D|nr:UDP-N-acetylglucosamine-transferase [Dyella terrae]ULU25285.1 Glycosyltransferase protein [Dyella terrae]